MMKKLICLAGAVLLCGGAAFGGLLSEDPGELAVAGQFWLPGEGDSDLFETGLGASVSYREWFSFPWGVGLNLGVSQWQVDSGSQAYKWQRLTDYDGDALILAFGPALYFNIIDWDNWDNEDATRDDIRWLHETAMRIADAKTRKAIQDEIEELEGEDLAEDEP